MLKAAYPEDDITRFRKGKDGADILDIVHSKGRDCGRTLVESKNTRSFSEAYVVKLGTDKIEAKADVAF